MKKIICHNQSEFDDAIKQVNALIVLQDTFDDISVYSKSLGKVRCRAVTPIAEVDIRGNEIKE